MEYKDEPRQSKATREYYMINIQPLCTLVTYVLGPLPPLASATLARHVYLGRYGVQDHCKCYVGRPRLDMTVTA